MGRACGVHGPGLPGSGVAGGEDEGRGEGEAAEHHDAEQRQNEVGGPQGLGAGALPPLRGPVQRKVVARHTPGWEGAGHLSPPS